LSYLTYFDLLNFSFTVTSVHFSGRKNKDYKRALIANHDHIKLDLGSISKYYYQISNKQNNLRIPTGCKVSSRLFAKGKKLTFELPKTKPESEDWNPGPPAQSRFKGVSHLSL